ncbi:DHA2 family efflux MFS transporter permease subunit [Celerinatantimonas yamalensis]|uniref:DHA2 family efflux MFS transporter permease subunit n=1 Tax=Celerinatantimonas yamalensis TaxID=559956 RepID=A0ABW9G5I4_9GAMM
MNNNDQFRPQNLTLAAIGLCLATFMQVLDTTIANVALPTIAGNMGVSSDQGNWVITSFAVCNAIALPLTGWVSRTIGETKLFLGAVILFAVSSFLCGTAQSMSELIFYRAIQGFCSGPLFPMAQTLMMAIFPRNKRTVALAVISMVTVVAPIVGPITGGWITDSYSWRWIFYINVPIAIFASIVVFTQLKDRPEPTVKTPVDYMGLGLLVIGVGALQIMLDKGNNLDWFSSNMIVILASIASVALTAFVIWETTSEHPIVNLELFKDRNFTVGTIALVFGYSAFFAINLILPQWLEQNLGYTAIWAGLAAAPMGIIPLFTSALVGKYAPKFDMRVLVTLSFIIISSSCFMRANFDLSVNFWDIALVQGYMGIGIVLFFMPLTTILLSNLPNNQLAEGAGLATFLRVLGSGFASSLSMWIWDRREIFHYSQLNENISQHSVTATSFFSKMGGLSQTALAQVQEIVEKQAVMMSTIDYFTLLGWLFVGLLAITWFAKPPFFRSH